MVLRINDIDPDGVRVAAPWEDLRVGMSFFVPCINTAKCIKQADEVAANLGYSLAYRTRVEGEKFGLRIWRTA